MPTGSTLKLSSQWAYVLAPAVAICLASCSDDPSPVATQEANARPSFIAGDVLRSSYDGSSNDLLTGGLGKSGLQAAAPPAFVDATNPTEAELRVRAIYNNYRGLVDMTPAGGYGVFFGPNVDSNGVAGTGEGRIAGEEWIALSDDGSGRENVTLMVQIPNSFNVAVPCIVTASSSGSRGVYGAIATAGEWGLKRGCAVAYTDKGTGNGGHELGSNTVYGLTGRRTDAVAAGRRSQFTANVSDADRATFNTAFPNRWAFKHAHSQLNPEKDWGKHTLQAVEFAFFVINERFGDVFSGQRLKSFRPDNTVVIASSVSNGAGAALAAAEQDTLGLIDGVAVSEPQIQVNLPSTLTITRGGQRVAAAGLGLYDYFTLANLHQPCAALQVPGSPGAVFVNPTIGGNRCAALAGKGLMASTDQSLNALRMAGWESETDVLHASHYAFATPPIVVTYLNSYGRFGVRDNACGFSFAANINGQPAALAGAASAQLFAAGNGIPPTGGLTIINNNAVGGPFLDASSISPSTNVLDYNVDGALCARNLFVATAAAPTNAAATTQRQAVLTGIGETKRTANLRGKPAIIVHGRADALIPVNHSSRPYLAVNRSVEGSASRLSYIEVTNAQHLDAFIGNALLAGYDTRYVPLHVYFNRAMDAMWNHLRTGAALPPSQVVRTTPRGGTAGAAPALAGSNVPAWSASPGAADQITFSNNTLNVPN
jgi:hydroxybutyrate-dimer hydrolase